MQTLCGEMIEFLFIFLHFFFFFFVRVGGVCALGPAHHCRDRLSQGSGSPLLESFDCGEWACGAPAAWPESVCVWVGIVAGFCGEMYEGFLVDFIIYYNI